MRVVIILIGMMILHVHHLSAQGSGQVLKVQIKKDVFVDEFFLLLEQGSSAGHDSFDAVKISDGFVSIASLESNKQRLSIHARPFPKGQEQIPLVLKGYAVGTYALVIDADKMTSNDIQVSLLDRYLNKSIQIESRQVNYEFNLDSTSLNGAGMNRFSLILNKVYPFQDPPTMDANLLAFPNPFTENLKINVNENATEQADIRIIDLNGKVCLRFKFKDVLKDDVLDLPCGALLPGIYLLEWKSGSRRKTLKIVKI